MHIVYTIMNHPRNHLTLKLNAFLKMRQPYQFYFTIQSLKVYFFVLDKLVNIHIIFKTCSKYFKQTKVIKTTIRGQHQVRNNYKSIYHILWETHICNNKNMKIGQRLFIYFALWTYFWTNYLYWREYAHSQTYITLWSTSVNPIESQEKKQFL